MHGSMSERHFHARSWTVAAARRLTAGAALALAIAASPAGAVVIDSGSMSDFSPIRTAPTGDEGWSRVGKVGAGAGSGVYLGNGWVLTAAHVGAGAFTLDGVTYQAKTGSSQRLTNPDNSITDLIVYELQTRPTLGLINLASSRPGAGSLVTMIGYGITQTPGLVFWDAAWNKVSSSSSWTYYGYEVGGDYTKQWGQNYILAGPSGGNSNYLVSGGYGTVSAMLTQFYDYTGVTAGAQAVPGDSGGGVFFNNGGTWELAGIMHAVFTYSGQNVWTQAAYGDQTSIADLTVYRDQIVAITAVPEPSAVALAGVAVAVGIARYRRRGRTS